MFIHPSVIASSIRKITTPLGAGDPYWANVSLFSKFDTNYDSYWSNVKLAAHMTHDPYWANVVALYHTNKDPNWNNVVLALHMNGANGSSTFTDEAGKTFITSGATTSTTQKRFGQSSGYFSGSSQYTYTTTTPSDFAFGTNDFTIECWFYISSGSSGPRTIIDKTSSYANGSIDFRLEINAQGIFSFLGGPNINWYGGSLVNSTNTWHHGAVVRNGSSLLTFVDGILQSSQDATPINIGNIKTELCIGSYNNGGRGNYFSGYLDDIRITKNVARYTTDFEVYRGQFLDNKPFDETGKSITISGNTTLSTSQVKFGNNSLYFDGNTDYIQYGAETGFNFGTEDFTIECWWYYVTNTNAYGALLSSGTTTGSWSSGCVGFAVSSTDIWLGYHNGSNQEICRYVGNWTEAWRHVALTRSSGTIRLFINGTLVSSGTYAGALNFNNNNMTRIGCNPWDPGTSGSLTGYLNEYRVSKGIARYTQTFTVPTSPYVDPFSYPPVIDIKSGKTLVSKSSTQSTQTNRSIYGGMSLLFDGIRDYVVSPTSTDFGFTTKDFTLEMWIKTTDSTACLLDFRTSSTEKGCYGIFDGYLSVWNGTNFLTSGTNLVNTNTWTHVVWQRYKGMLTQYVNGSLDGYIDFTAINLGSTRPVTIGAMYDGTNKFSGYMSDLRISNVGRYGSSFTPPTYAFLDPYNKPMFVEETGKQLVPYGNATLSSTQKKFGQTSCYFDGTGDYVQYSSSVITDIAFTIEAWVYTTVSAEQAIVSQYEASPTAGRLTFYINSSYALEFFIGSATYGNLVLTDPTTFPLNTWTHVAVTRSGDGVCCLFTNGALVALGSSIQTIYQGPVSIGGQYAPSTGLARPFTGYIDNIRITSGVDRHILTHTGNAYDPYWNNVVLAMDMQNGDPYWSSVSLIMRCDSADNGTTFFDNKFNRTVTRTGNVTAKTSVRKFISNAPSTSAYFGSPGGYLSLADHTDFELGSGDFTLECWVYPTAYANSFNGAYTSLLIGKQDSFHFAIQGTSSSWTSVTLGIYSGSTWYWYGPGITLSNNQWYHIACTRQSGTVRIFVNGIMTGASGTRAESCNNNAFALTIGGWGISTWEYYLTGYMDEIRITKGVARYTSDFTAPTEPFPIEYFKDLKGNPVITNGSPTLSSTQAKYGTHSAYFATGSDYLTFATNQQRFNLGAGALTIEFWFYAVTPYISTYPRLMMFGDNGSGQSLQFYINTTNNAMGVHEATGSPLIGFGTAAGVWTTDAWNHVALVFETATNKRLYINGIKVSEQLTNSFTNAANSFDIGNDSSYSGLPFKGYIDEVRITKGVARYSANFTPSQITTTKTYTHTFPIDPKPPISYGANTYDSYWNDNVVLSLPMNGDQYWNNTVSMLHMNTDPYWSYVALAMHMNGADNGTSFTDLTGKSITVFGNTVTKTAIKRFGTASAYFDGTGDYLTLTGTSMGTGDFTVEFWFYTTGNTSSQYVFESRSGNTADGILVYPRSSGKVGVWSGGVLVVQSNTTYTTHAWHHVATVRKDGVLSIFLDGVFEGSAAFTNNLTNTGWRLGQDNANSNPGQGFYVDDLRITVGIPRYVSSFTVSPKQFLDNQFIDEKGKTITVAGNATIIQSLKKFNEGSAYFDGNGDYLTLGSSSDFDFGTGDFTVECWVYQYPTANLYGTVLSSNTATWSAGAVGIFCNATDVWVGLHDGVGQTIVIDSKAPLTWLHIAVTRASGTVRLFIDGELRSTGTYAGTINFNHNSNTRIGQNGWDGATTGAFQGCIDDMRITKGIARYTASFTPPTTAFPDNEFIDTKYGAMIVPYGNAAISGTQNRFGKTSAYFDGTGDYLILPPSPNWNFGTGDFTIECWVYITANGTLDPINRYYQLICAVDTITSGRVMEFTIAGDSNSTGVGLNLWNGTYGTAPIFLAFNKNCWNFITVSRTTGIVYFSVNGAVSTPIPFEYALGNSTSSLLIGGSPHGTYNYYVNGYIDDLRITTGVGKYVNTFIPPQIQHPVLTSSTDSPLGDPYWNNVVFATHFEQDIFWAETVFACHMNGDPHWNNVNFASRFSGLDNGTSFTELKGLTITRGGNAVTKTDIVKNGSACLYLDGSSYLTVPTGTGLSFGSGDFTIECWFYRTVDMSSGTFRLVNEWNGQGYIFSIVNNTVVITCNNGTNYSVATALTNINMWHHAAAVRSGSNLYVFLDGIMSSTTVSGTIPANIGTTYIGRASDGASQYFTGYIDELRITKGVARYTSNFTPSSTAFLSGVLTDVRNAKTITAYGNAALSTTQSKFGMSSAYFDGNGSYLSVPDSTDWDFGTGDFTIECWIYIAANSSTNGQNNRIAQIVGNFYNGVTSASGFTFNINGDSISTGTGLYFSYNNAGSWTTLITSTRPISQGTWHHVSVTRTNSIVRLFVDGDIHAEGFSSTNISLGYELAIGGQPNYTNYNSWFNGYINDLRITKGVSRYSYNFTPSQRTFLESGFVDVTGRENGISIIGSVGNLVVDKAEKRFGSTSAYFDGSGDYIYTTNQLSNYAFGTGDFTVEAWIKMPIMTTDRIIVDFYRNGSSTWQFLVNATGYLTFYQGNPNAIGCVATKYLVNNNIWHHVVACRTGGTLMLFVDGMLAGSAANSKDHNARADYLAIGAQVTTRNSAYDFYGYIDDVRITKGTCRYTTTFNPPERFPDFLTFE